MHLITLDGGPGNVTTGSYDVIAVPPWKLHKGSMIAAPRWFIHPDDPGLPVAVTIRLQGRFAESDGWKTLRTWTQADFTGEAPGLTIFSDLGTWVGGVSNTIGPDNNPAAIPYLRLQITGITYALSQVICHVLLL